MSQIKLREFITSISTTNKSSVFKTGSLSQSKVVFFFSFSNRVFFHGHWRDSRGMEETIFYSTLPPPPAHEHSDIYLQLCMWDNYHAFLITTLVFTRLLLDEIYHLIELSFDSLTDDATLVCLIDSLILGFCYSNLTRETGGFEPTSTITIVLQSSQLIKCASHP